MEVEKLFQQIETFSAAKKYIDGPRSLSFRDLFLYSNKFCAFLHSQGLRPDDRIAVASVDDLEVAAIFLSALRYGLSVLILDPAGKSNEVAEFLGRAKVSAIFLDQELAERWSVEAANDSTPLVWKIAKQKKKLISRLLGGTPDRKESAVQNYPECLAKFEKESWHPSSAHKGDPSLLLCTSGTTGQPKILRLTFNNMAAAAAVAEKQLGFTSQSRMLDLLPVNHYDGIVSGLITAFCGAFTLIRLGPFSVPMLPDVFDAIYKYRATHLQLTPSVLSLMMRLGENLQASFETDDFQFIISVAAALPEKLWSDFEQKSHKRIVNVYGLSETGNYLFAGPDEESHRIGSVGKPVDCNVLIVNAEGMPLQIGEVGEVLMDTDSVTPGYVDQSAGQVVINGVEWFPTGDLGYVDEEGIYWLVGRKKNIVIVGGRNVYPDEVNNVLLDHPGVTEAATVGLPDEIWGERIVSCVTAHGAASTQDLMRFVSERLTDYKAPREIHILSELPKGRSGKVQLQALVEQLQSGMPQKGLLPAENLQEKILTLASQSFRVPLEELSLDTTPQNCGRWDSVAHMDFVVNLETNFKMELLPREVIQITSIAAAMRIVTEKLQV